MRRSGRLTHCKESKQFKLDKKKMSLTTRVHHHSNTSKRCWNKSTHRIYFDWLGKELHFEKMEDWYNLTLNDIHRYRGDVLLKRYRNSIVLALSDVYPKHQWLPWKFSSSTPYGYWKNKSNHNIFFDWLGKELNY